MKVKTWRQNPLRSLQNNTGTQITGKVSFFYGAEMSVRVLMEAKNVNVSCIFGLEITGSPSSKYEHRDCCVTFEVKRE